jgi:hypothetical protein
MASVSFVLPDAPGSPARVPVKINIEVLRVFNALPPRSSHSLAVARIDGNRRMWEQAERVAWRNLVLWVTAALSAATLGLQTITEAFFAHTVTGEHGERMIEVVERHQATLGTGTQRLLASGADDA